MGTHPAIAAALAAFPGAAEPAAPERPVTRKPLRPYQAEALARVREELASNRSTLLVMATGLGKTRIFAELAREWPDNVLVVAHRDELIGQAARSLEEETGEPVDIEQADMHAAVTSRVVVASVQTMSRIKRMRRFGQNRFGLVIVDESHHAPSETYRRILDFFSGAKVLGVTATPDRGDRRALGAVFESVAYVYDVEDGIKNGWLAPIVARRVRIDSVNLDDVRTTAGDLNQGDLDAIMRTEENIHGVVRPCVELCGGRQTIVFTTSVATAHRMAEVFNRYRAGSAKAVDGETAKGARREIIGGFLSKQFQYLVNVGVATEGFDAPETSCIAIARPTKSRALYAQMAGRGLRVAPGKRDCLLLDFVGNSGRHALVGPEDILGGRHTDAEVARARDIVAAEPGVRVDVALERARKDEEEAQRKLEAARARDAAKRLAAKAQVRYSTGNVDPFRVLGVDNPEERWRGQFGEDPASEAQLGLLSRMKIDIPQGITKRAANKLIGAAFARNDAGLCTYRQAKFLGRYGVDTEHLSRERAGHIYQEIKNNAFRPLSFGRLMALQHGEI